MIICLIWWFNVPLNNLSVLSDRQSLNFLCINHNLRDLRSFAKRHNSASVGFEPFDASISMVNLKLII